MVNVMCMMCSQPMARTRALLRQEIASFLTSSTVGSRCVLYLARGCQRSYCACKFLPGQRMDGQRASSTICHDQYMSVLVIRMLNKVL